MPSAELALVVLPGLDGSATLRADFIAAVAPAFGQIMIVEYPANGAQDLGTLEHVARAALPTDCPFILLGESFSGPISLRIAGTPPRNLRALVLSTTFARRPTRFAGAAVLLKPLLRLAIGAVAPTALPRTWLRWWLLGDGAPAALVEAVRERILALDVAVLRARALAALTADAFAMLPRIGLPTLYLRGRRDRLLRTSAASEIVDRIAGARLVEIDGPHLLLQQAPSQCAQALAQFAESIDASS